MVLGEKFERSGVKLSEELPLVHEMPLLLEAVYARAKGLPDLVCEVGLDLPCIHGAPHRLWDLHVDCDVAPSFREPKPCQAFVAEPTERPVYAKNYRVLVNGRAMRRREMPTKCPIKQHLRIADTAIFGPSVLAAN